MFWSVVKLPREKFPALTGIRAIAAYLVFFHHFALPAGTVPLAVARFLKEGHVGVTLFYVLSGFLITYNYSQKAEKRTRSFWLLYLSRRIARIYPLYLFLVVLTFLLPAWLQGEPLPSFATLFLNLTLLKGFFTQFNMTGIAPAWSLTVEETFYLLAPFLFAGVRRYGYPAVQAALYGVGAILLGIGTHIAFSGFFDSFYFVALYTFFGRSFEFLAGMALAHALLRQPDVLRVRRWVPFTYLGIAGFVAVVFWLSLLQQDNTFGLYHPIGMALNNFALPLFICILFTGLLSERTICGAILASPLFVFLGRISYAFYLVHHGVLAGLAQTYLAFIPNELFRFFAIFLAVNAISAILFLALEHPANLLVRHGADRLIARLKPAPPADDPSQRLRRYALAWSSAFAAVFVIWCAAVFGWLLPPVDAANAHRPTKIADSPRLGKLISSKTEFFVVTSQVGQIPRLTYTVGGVPIAREPFIFAHANSTLEYDISEEGASIFEFSTGLDDFGGADRGSVQYILRGDGRVIFLTPVIHAMQKPIRYIVPVVGVHRLQLSITDAGDGTNSDESYWIRPLLR